MPIIRYDLYMRSWDSNSDDDWFLHSSYPEDARGLAEASKDCYENHQKKWNKSCWWKYKVEKVTKEVSEDYYNYDHRDIRAHRKEVKK